MENFISDNMQQIMDLAGPLTDNEKSFLNWFPENKLAIIRVLIERTVVNFIGSSNVESGDEASAVLTEISELVVGAKGKLATEIRAILYPADEAPDAIETVEEEVAE
jgi:hypothetical protein